MAKVVVDAGDIAKHITVTIKMKGVKGFQFRLWLATQILKLAFRISRFQISFENWSKEADIIG